MDKRGIIFIFALLVLTACSSLRRTEQGSTEATTTTERDSTTTASANVQQGGQMQETKHIFDSIFTHVTIYRYDTITQKVVEKIVIEQQQVQRDESVTELRDSLQVDMQASNATHARDSVQIIEQHSTATRGGRSGWRWFCFGLLFGAVAAICLYFAIRPRG